MPINTKWLLCGTAAVAGTLAGLAWITRRNEQRSARAHPPVGRFIEVDGVRLHYAEFGQGGPPLVLLHGHNSMIQDFVAGGLAQAASARYRTIVFDRPGCGYSSRPRGRVWTPQAQAELLRKALQHLGVDQPIVVGVSWGALVAMALALDHPHHVRSLVLVSGYLYPTIRLDALPFAALAIPGLGTALAYAGASFLGRFVWPGMTRKVFAPQQVPPEHASFPLALVLRPLQLRTAAAEGFLMMPAALTLSRRYGGLKVPLAVVAGTEDRMIDTDRHSARLCRELPKAWCRLVPGLGHMVHYHPHHVLAAVEATQQA